MRKFALGTILVVSSILGILGVNAVTRIANLPPFDSVTDVGKALIINSGGTGLQYSVAGGVSGALKATGAVANNSLAQWDGTTGRLLEDSGIPSANVVLVSRAVQAGTGLTVTNSGLLSADITMSLANGPTASVLGIPAGASAPTSITSTVGNSVLISNSGSTGVLWGKVLLSGSSGVTGILAIANGGTASATAGSGYQNLSPMTTKGDVTVYSTAPIRLAVGASGSILTAYPGQASGLGWSTSTTQVWGTQTNDNAAVGYVGEAPAKIGQTANGIALTSNTACNVGSTTCPNTGGTQSITLTPGDWDVRGACGYVTGATTNVTQWACAVSKTSNTMPSLNTVAWPTSGEMFELRSFAAQVIAGTYNTVEIPPFRVSIASNTTIYLVGQSTFTVSTVNVFGYLEARRVR